MVRAEKNGGGGAFGTNEAKNKEVTEKIGEQEIDYT